MVAQNPEKQPGPDKTISFHPMIGQAAKGLLKNPPEITKYMAAVRTNVDLVVAATLAYVEANVEKAVPEKSRRKGE